MDARAEYLQDLRHRREFVRAAAFLAGLADVGREHRAWLLTALEMLTSRDPDIVRA